MRFPAAHGGALALAKLKTFPQDFIVEETLAFLPPQPLEKRPPVPGNDLTEGETGSLNR